MEYSHKAFFAALSLILIVGTGLPLATAAVPSHPAAAKKTSASGAVKIGDRVVFSNLDKVPGSVNVPFVQDKLNAALCHGDYPYKGAVKVVQRAGQFVINLGQDDVITVDATIAKALGTTPAALSKKWADSLQAAVSDQNLMKQHFTSLAKGDPRFSTAGAGHLYDYDQEGAMRIADELVQKNGSPRTYSLRTSLRMMKIGKEGTLLGKTDSEPSREAIDNLLQQVNGAISDALKADKNMPGYRQMLGALYRGSGQMYKALDDYESAESNYRKAATYMPEDAELTASLINTLLDANKTEEAIKTSDAAIQAFPKNDEVVFARARALIFNRRLDEAIQLIKDAGLEEPKSPDDARGLFYIAESLIASGKSKDARTLVNAWASKAAPSVYLYDRIVFFNLDTGDLESAIQDQKKLQDAAAKENRKSDMADRQLATVDLLAGKYPEAVTAIEPALRRNKPQPIQSEYKLILRTIAARALHDDTKSTALAEAAGIKFSGNQPWPRPILDYLDGKISREQLFSAADNNCTQTEARGYIGLYDLVTGDKTKARQNFEWVNTNGNPDFMEYSFSRAGLNKLNHESK